MDARTPHTPDTTAVGVMGLDVPPARHSLAVSPINRRRWQNFKANRRGYWAFWIFLVLFVVTLFAEFLAKTGPLSSQDRRDLFKHVLEHEVGVDAAMAATGIRPQQSGDDLQRRRFSGTARAENDLRPPAEQREAHVLQHDVVVKRQLHMIEHDDRPVLSRIGAVLDVAPGRPLSLRVHQ